MPPVTTYFMGDCRIRSRNSAAAVAFCVEEKECGFRLILVAAAVAEGSSRVAIFNQNWSKAQRIIMNFSILFGGN